MKAIWGRFAAAFDARAVRERILIIVAACAVVFMLFDTTATRSVVTERRRLAQDLLNDQAELAKLATQLQAFAKQRGADPDATLKSRLVELAARQAELQKQIDAQSVELVPPEKMPAVLEKIVAGNPRVQLIEIKTMPRSSVSLAKIPVATDAASKGGEAKAGDAKAGEAKAADARAGEGKPQDAKPSAADDKRSAEIYRHGVEVTLRGSYLDILAYLKEFESLPVRMFWERVSLNASAYPMVTVRLVVYTISLDQAWLTV